MVNPAFCRMFRVETSAVIGQPGARILGDFEEVLTTHEPILEREKAFPHLDLYIHQVTFVVEGQNLVACINVDRSLNYLQRAERKRLKQETIYLASSRHDRELATLASKAARGTLPPRIPSARTCSGPGP